MDGGLRAGGRGGEGDMDRHRRQMRSQDDDGRRIYRFSCKVRSTKTRLSSGRFDIKNIVILKLHADGGCGDGAN